MEKITITDKEKEVVKMYLNEYKYELDHEKAVNEAKEARINEYRLSSIETMVKAIGKARRAIIIKRKLWKYRGIIEDKCIRYDISKKRRYFLEALVSTLILESVGKYIKNHYVFLSCNLVGYLDAKYKEIILSFEDQEYLEELRGYLKDIDKDEYEDDEEWINIVVAMLGVTNAGTVPEKTLDKNKKLL